MSDDCWFCSPWFAVTLIVLEWKLGVVRFVLSTVLQTIERYTSPKIVLDAPKVKFDEKPSATRLTPQSAGPGVIQCFDKGTNTPLGIVRACPVSKSVPHSVPVWRRRPGPEQLLHTPEAALFSVRFRDQSVCSARQHPWNADHDGRHLGRDSDHLGEARWTAATARRFGEEVRDVGFHDAQACRGQLHSFGVIGAIVSWNYPFHNIMDL